MYCFRKRTTTKKMGPVDCSWASTLDSKTETDNLCLIPRPYLFEEQNQVLQAGFWPPYVCCGVYADPPINTPNKAIKKNRLMLGSNFRLKFDESRWTKEIRKLRNDQKEPHGDGIRECGVWSSSRLLHFSLMSPKQLCELPEQLSITSLL